MAWKYRRWKIRWQPKQRKFKKIQRDRQGSRKAHLRWKKNRGKMKMALRKARIKGKITQKKNKAKGIYKKLAVARKRWKNILKSDVNLDLFMDLNVLSEEQLTEKYGAPELEVDASSDISDIIAALKDMKQNLGMADFEDEELKDEYLADAIDKLEEIEEKEELEDEDEDFIEEVISVIEEFAEAADIIDTDDEQGKKVYLFLGDNLDDHNSRKSIDPRVYQQAVDFVQNRYRHNNNIISKDLIRVEIRESIYSLLENNFGIPGYIAGDFHIEVYDMDKEGHYPVVITMKHRDLEQENVQDNFIIY